VGSLPRGGCGKPSHTEIPPAAAARWELRLIFT
jgi:hypothetical protein